MEALQAAVRTLEVTAANIQTKVAEKFEEVKNEWAEQFKSLIAKSDGHEVKLTHHNQRADQITQENRGQEAKINDLHARMEVLSDLVARASRDDTSNKSNLRIKDAEKYVPNKRSGKPGSVPFTDFQFDLANWATVVDATGVGARMLQEAAMETGIVDDLWIQQRAAANPVTAEFSRILGNTLASCTTETAKNMVKRALQADFVNGLRAWQVLC